MEKPFDLHTFLSGFAMAACVYMAGGFGANDVANAMGTSVGLKTFTFRQAIIVAVIGFGLLAGGAKAVHWGKAGSIVMSWIVSPLMDGLFSFAIFRFITLKILDRHYPLRQAKTHIPYLVFPVFTILSISLVYNERREVWNP